jgi:hypothetical protein
MQPSAFAVLAHPFGATLKDWERGVPVDCGPDWSLEAIYEAVAHGPHPTATTPDAIALFQEDIAYQVQAGFAEIMFWEDLQMDLPKNLKISPAAAVPQANRRARIILDLSFPVRRPERAGRRQRMGPMLAPSVNETTVKLSPQTAVKEIGKVLTRVLHFMSRTPPDQQIFLSKVDLSDGFWRMIVEPSQKWNFCYVMPDPPGSPVRIVVPSALQMGWAESPAYFCTATETGRDIIQWLVDAKVDLPVHPFEKFMIPDPLPEGHGDGDKEIHVYVDDYILAVVQDEEQVLLRRVARATLHGIHAIFPPPGTSGHVGGKDPISEKKLAKGDAMFALVKEILGFMLDGASRTVWLPENKRDAIITELKRLMKMKHCPLKRFQSITGKLLNATKIAPSTKSLLTPFFQAQRNKPKLVGIGQHSALRQALQDLPTLIMDLTRRPTHVNEIVPHPPSVAGCCDASLDGAGGVIFSHEFDPVVWRLEWPPEVKARYRAGKLNNNDLEMAGIVAQTLITERLVYMRHRHSAVFTDNSSAKSWSTKLVTKSESPAASSLIRALAIRQRTTEAAFPVVEHWAGIDNVQADVASRSFATFHSGPYKGVPATTDTVFLNLFALTFPLPSKAASWHMLTIGHEAHSLLISTLLGARSTMPQWMSLPVGAPGAFGQAIAWPTDTLTPSAQNSPPPNDSSSFWPLLPAPVQALLAGASKSKLARSPAPCATSLKLLNWQDIEIPVAPTERTT